MGLGGRGGGGGAGWHFGCGPDKSWRHERIVPHGRNRVGDGNGQVRQATGSGECGLVGAGRSGGRAGAGPSCAPSAGGGASFASGVRAAVAGTSVVPSKDS